jgi:integrase
LVDGAGSPVCSWWLRRRFYSALDAAGLRRVSFHDLRHVSATLAVQQ